MGTEYNLVLKMPPHAKGWRVTVLVYGRDDDLLATDEGNLMCLPTRQRVAERLRQQLGIEDAKAETFAEGLDKAWLAFYRAYQEQAGAGPAQLSAAELLEQMPADVQREAHDLLHDAALVARVGDDLAALGIAGERQLCLTLYLVGVSRQLGRPLNARVHGPTSSGKSYVVETVAQCFPAECVLHATQITPQAFFHMAPGSLKNRVVVAGERTRIEDDQAAEKTRALRELQASGRLSKLISVKGPRGEIETQHIEQEGPIAYVETTSAVRVFEEDANRCLTLFTDEQPGQTKRIIETLAAGYQGKTAPVQTQRLIQKHHAVQRLLQPHPVVIPYAEALAARLDCQRVELRRGFPQLMSMVQAVTLLHQWQRERDADGRLIATPADYRLARTLLLTPLARLLGAGVSEPARRFFERLERWGHGQFSTTDASRRESYSSDAVRGWLAELAEAGVVRVVSESRGRAPAVWELTGNGIEDGGGILPPVEDVCDQGGGAAHRHNR